MKFFNIGYERILLGTGGEVEDIVILRSSVVVFYNQRYTVHDSTHVHSTKADHFLTHRIVKPQQVEDELIAAVQPRGRLIILNPYTNQVLELLDLPILTQKNNSEWFFFNQYYRFHQSGIFTYRERGFGDSIGLVTFRERVKVSSFKHNIAVKGASDSVYSSIDKFDDSCTLCIYEPGLKRAVFRYQLLTLPSNQVHEKSLQMGQLFTLHKGIKILLIRQIDQEFFMICLSSQSVKSLFLIVSQINGEITHVLQSQSRFSRPLLEINLDPHYLLFESIRLSPPGVMIEALYTHSNPTLEIVGEIVSGEIRAGCLGNRIYKWWPDTEDRVQIHMWSVYPKRKLFRHLLRARRTDQIYGEHLCAKVIRLLK